MTQNATKDTTLSLEGIPRTINGRHAFVHERLLEVIARETLRQGGVSFRKTEMSQRMRCSTLSLTRAVTRLRDEGFITIEPRFASHGGQLANYYTATPAGLERAAGIEGLCREGA